MREALLRLLEPPVEALHYELVDLEFLPSARGGVLRLYIDRATGGPAAGGAAADAADAAVTVEDCARVSHAVSEVLEAEDPIKGHYTLEVSSPGFDRVLRKRAHFERFVGARVWVELKLPMDGRRRYIGALTGVADEGVTVDVDGRACLLPFERIQKARLRPQ